MSLPDNLRKLTSGGIRKIELLADFFNKNNSLSIDQIYHSPLVRAKQTAEYFNTFMDNKLSVEEWSSLRPNDHPSLISDYIETLNRNIMLIGHLPHLERLASYLLCGDADKKIVNLNKCGLICLENVLSLEHYPVKKFSWILNWAMSPKLIK